PPPPPPLRCGGPRFVDRIRRGLSRRRWDPSAAPFTMEASPPPRKGSAEHMDISKLSHGAKLIIGGTVAFLIVSIFNWQEVDTGIISVCRSMWHGWGALSGATG